MLRRHAPPQYELLLCMWHRLQSYYGKHLICPAQQVVSMARRHLPAILMQAAVATLYAGAIGGLVAAFLCKPTRRSWREAATLSEVTIGLLAGLVSSASTCGVVPLWAHTVTAALAAGAAKAACRLLARAGIDDVSSVVPIHLVGGVISVLSVGLFAEADLIQQISQLPSKEAAQKSAGAFAGGDGMQLLLQFVWLLFILTWSIVITVPLCLTLRAIGHLRNDTRSSLKGMALINLSSVASCGMPGVCLQ
jgi:ammonia channel protein AmtB